MPSTSTGSMSENAFSSKVGKRKSVDDMPSKTISRNFCSFDLFYIFVYILGGKFKFKDSIRERFSHEFESLDTSRSHKLERHSESRRSIDGWTDESKAAKVMKFNFIKKKFQI